MKGTVITRAMVKKIVNPIKASVVVLCAALALSGCAGKTASSIGPIFFPPPPDDPHVQFLLGISSSKDFGPTQSKLSSLISGGRETITKLNRPYGITAKKGKVYVCDVEASRIVVIDFAKKTMKNLNDEIGQAELKKPIGVAVDDDGNVYVADNGRKDIPMYTAEGKYVKAFGEGLQHASIVGVAIHDGYLLALDSRKGKVFIMDKKSGELISTIGENPDTSQNLALPNGFTIDPKGVIHVVNMGNGKVKEYDLDGHLLATFGELGDNPGEFTRPRGVAIDENGWTFIVDGGHQVVQVFNEQHRTLGHFGKPGLPAGSMNLPAGVAVSRDNLDYFQKYAAPGFKLQEVIFVTNQYSTSINQPLAIYGLGEMEGKKTEAPEKTPAPKEEKPKTP